MSQTAIKLEATRGSDLRVRLTLSSRPAADQPRAPVDLTGRSVAVIEQSERLQGRVSVAIVDATQGAIEVLVDGTDPLEVGQYRWRVQIAGPGDSVGLPMFDLRVY